MPTKTYQIPDNAPSAVAEPAVAYGNINGMQPVYSENFASGEWNPNVPFHGTQEEWWEHFHRIEEGNFVTWEEHQMKFDTWKRKILSNLM